MKKPTEPGSTPRARRRQARFKAILDAAMDLLVTDGLDGLTIHQLAKAVDYTPGALYHYFASKDAIIAELQLQIFATIHDYFGSCGVFATTRPRKRVSTRRWLR